MAKFDVTYTQADFGTDRLVTVKKGDKVIGMRDPFHTCGIPSDFNVRRGMIVLTARRIIRDYNKSLRKG